MDDFFSIFIPVVSIFVVLPWIIFHYITKWKQAPRMTDEDENLLDDMYSLARRLEDRLNTVERIVAADHPDWRQLPNREPEPDFQSFETFERTRRN